MKKLKKAALAKAVIDPTPLRKVGTRKGFDLGHYPDADYDLLPLSVEREGFTRVSKVVPPQTFRKVFHDGRPNIEFCTVMPNGLRVGWANCGGCHNHVSICKCGAGVSADRAVEYIYDQTVARQAGEEWDHHHKRYKQGSLYELRRGRRAAEIDSKNGVKKTLKKRTEEPKKLMKKASTPLRAEAFDTKKLGEIAREVADDAEKELNTRLRKLEGAGNKKTLTKGPRKTKLLRSSK